MKEWPFGKGLLGELAREIVSNPELQANLKRVGQQLLQDLTKNPSGHPQKTLTEVFTDLFSAQTTPTREPRTRWDYNQFRQALVNSCQDIDQTPSLREYPESIELSSRWNQLLEETRQVTTESGHNHFALIGFSPEASSIYISTHPSRDAGRDFDSYLKGHQGLAIGPIFSKPPFKFTDMLSHGFGDRIKPDPTPEELYPLVTQDSTYRLMIMVTNLENRLIIRSKETLKTLVNPGFMKSHEFSDFYKVVAGNSQTKDQSPFPFGFENDGWEINKLIATKHKLAIYQGIPNQSLLKIFPL